MLPFILPKKAQVSPEFQIAMEDTDIAQTNKTLEFDVLSVINDELDRETFKKFKDIVLNSNLKKAGSLSDTEKAWLGILFAIDIITIKMISVYGDISEQETLK